MSKVTIYHWFNEILSDLQHTITTFAYFEEKNSQKRHFFELQIDDKLLSILLFRFLDWIFLIPDQLIIFVPYFVQEKFNEFIE